MAIEFKRNEDEVRADLVALAQEHGFTRLDRFIGGFIDVFSDVFGNLYEENYSLDDQTRMDTASGEFLDGFGLFLEEPRGQNPIVQDLSFNNVFITTSDGKPVTNYTVGGSSLLIPNGTRILDDTGSPILTLVDTIAMNTDRIFIRVVGDGLTAGTVAPGQYKLDGDISSFATARLLGNSAGVLFGTVPDLNIVIQTPIEGKSIELDDSDYRFSLFAKSRSRNLTNKERVDVELKDTRIARFIIKQFTSGSSSVSIYIEPVAGLLQKPLEQAIKTVMMATMPDGTVVHIARMVGSIVELDIEMTLTTGVESNLRNDVKDSVLVNVINHLLDLPSGSSLDKTLLLDAVINTARVGSAKIKELKVNGRKIHSTSYEMRDIEYVFTSEQAINISVV